MYRADGTQLVVHGRPVPRPAGTPLPCPGCPKIPPGAAPHPANAVELTAANRRCWEHWRECRAVGWRVPDAADPLVRRHAALLDAVAAGAERERAAAALAAVSDGERNGRA